jgi:hypothetical protein
MKINLFDTNNPSCNLWFNGWQPCNDVEYIRPPLLEFDGPTVFTDELILHPVVDQVSSKYKFGLFIEPKSIKPDAYMALAENPNLVNKFDAIFTHDERLLSISSKFRLFPFLAGAYILKEDIKIYNKSKSLSIVASEKVWAEGHRLRHEVIKQYGNKMDCYGPFYKNLYEDYKNESTETLKGAYLKVTGNLFRAFKDYRYAMVIHSIRCKNYFDEKLLNCFFTGTVPIVWSPTNVGEFFDIDGCLEFSNLDDLEEVLDNLSVEDYDSRREAIKNNFEIAHKYISFDRYLKEQIEVYTEEN